MSLTALRDRGARSARRCANWAALAGDPGRQRRGRRRGAGRRGGGRLLAAHRRGVRQRVGLRRRGASAAARSHRRWCSARCRSPGSRPWRVRSPGRSCSRREQWVAGAAGARSSGCRWRPWRCGPSTAWRVGGSCSCPPGSCSTTSTRWWSRCSFPRRSIRRLGPAPADARRRALDLTQRALGLAAGARARRADGGRADGKAVAPSRSSRWSGSSSPPRVRAPCSPRPPRAGSRSARPRHVRRRCRRPRRRRRRRAPRSDRAPLDGPARRRRPSMPSTRHGRGAP